MSKSTFYEQLNLGTSYERAGGVFSAPDETNRVTATVENTSDSTTIDVRLVGRHQYDGGTSGWVEVDERLSLTTTDEPYSWIVEPEYDQYAIEARAQSGTADAQTFFRP